MKALISILTLSLLLTACVPQQSQEPTPTDDVMTDQEESRMVESDFFADYGLTFSYPADLVLSETYNEDTLFLDTVDRSTYEGDGIFNWTSIAVESDGDLEDYLATLSENEQYEATSYEANGNEFTRVSYYSEYGDYVPVTFYLDLGENGYFRLSQAAEALDKNPPLITETAEAVLGSVQVN